MNNLMIFESQDFGTIKTILKDGEPIFLANPLSEILGYSKTNSMVRRLDDDEKMEISSKDFGVYLT
ncbi:BRO family protein [Clostridium paraputrificum]|uniref:BRO family protein n=1 Tax=Clostridium paraputrificum TaxID=29363 RepID=UPI0034A3316E